MPKTSALVRTCWKPISCRLANSTTISRSFLTLGFCPEMLSRLNCASSAAYLTIAYISLQQGLLHEHAVHAESFSLQLAYPTTTCFWCCVAQLPYVMRVPVYCCRPSLFSGPCTCWREPTRVCQLCYQVCSPCSHFQNEFQVKWLCRWTFC